MSDRNEDVAVGLDYHSGSVQVAVMSMSGTLLANRRCRNDLHEVADACARHGRVRGVAIEACCGSAEFAHQLIELTGWSVELAHPGYVARMKQSPDKSDRSDAEVLADLTRVGYLPRVWLAPAYLRELRMLDSMRDGLAEECRRCKQQVRAVLREQRVRATENVGGPWTRKWVAWLLEKAPLSPAGRFVVETTVERLNRTLKQRCEVESRMREHTRGDKVVEALVREPGIGEVIAWKLRARIGRFDRFRSGKQLSRFCGLSPRNASSGQRQSDSGLIHACDRPLRAMILQAAHHLRIRDTRWRWMFERHRGRGVHPNVAVAAVANRWLRVLWQRMKEVSTADQG